ncbi:HEAT repeat domain-containing protein [Bacillus suaedae]|uniref:HEAT repeat domain-containing protein n=1 Tax=Halalkalibacter suaedae TaxID=2822140 RepID=A0A941AP36_9BACI|nr:HEAT repeat domain-containing protein [Bacillus suaedae]MBP3951057.1 HEAT repeat domain-containing protein [Bacillus suaedae]
MSQETKPEVPANLSQLKKSINRAANWRERLDTVEELGQWKSRETIELLRYCMAGDAVFKIRKAAFRKLRDLGEDVSEPERSNDEPIKGTAKTLLRIKKSLPKDHSYEDFREKVKKMRIDLYDTYEGEKGEEFDQWLKESWNSIVLK